MNKHQNKKVGVNLNERQRGQVAELQLSIMKAREQRRLQDQQLLQAEAHQIDALAAQIAVELDVDMKNFVMDLDTYKFVPRQVPLNGTQMQGLLQNRRKRDANEDTEI